MHKALNLHSKHVVEPSSGSIPVWHRINIIEPSRNGSHEGVCKIVYKECGFLVSYFKHERAQMFTYKIQNQESKLSSYMDQQSIVMCRMTQLQPYLASRSSFQAHFYLSFQVMLVNDANDISHRSKCSDFVEDFNLMKPSEKLQARYFLLIHRLRRYFNWKKLYDNKI